MRRHTGWVIGGLVLGACTTDVDESFTLDCTGVDGLRVGQSEEVVLTYLSGQADEVRWAIRPEVAGAFERETAALQDTGNVRPRTARNWLTVHTAGEATLAVLRHGEEIASCVVTFPTARARRLRVTVEGKGTVTSSPMGIDCPGVCTAPFALSSTVELTAEWMAPTVFAGFSGDCEATEVDTRGTVFMSDDRACRVRFADPPPSVSIPSGAFRRGCAADLSCPSDAQPLDTVQVSAYAIGKTEVTVADYRACVQGGACTEPRRAMAGEAPCNFHEDNRDNHPVNCVRWDQAAAFCDFVGQRLPTAAEWEKAARGPGNPFRFPWGDEAATCARANMIPTMSSMPCSTETRPVGERPEGDSPFGVSDMAGNLEEWVSDWYASGYYRTQDSWNDPTGPSISTGRREVRGGSFATTEVFGRVFDRSRHAESEDGLNGKGFRCAVDR